MKPHASYGDAVLLPRGSFQVLASDPGVPTVDIASLARVAVSDNIYLVGGEPDAVDPPPQGDSPDVMFCGTLRFNRNGFDIVDASAGLFGGSVRFEGGMVPTGDGELSLVRFRGQGEARVERLREAGLGLASHLLERANGSARYTAELAFRGGTPEIKVASTLEGVALALPAPLAKAAADALPLRFENTVLTSSP